MPAAANARTAALCAALALSGSGAGARQRIPDPPTTAMEPQVAAKIAQERRAVGENPESAVAWGSLGRTLQAHGLEDEAGRSYLRAAALDPEDSRWPYLLAVVLKNREPREALEAAERSARLAPDYAPAHLLAAELLERAGRPAAALARYRRALAAAPRSAAAELGVGRLRMLDGELEAAREHLDRAAAVQPRAGPIHAALARLHARRGEPEAAARESDIARGLPARVRVNDPLMREVGDAAVSSRGYERRALRAEAAGHPRQAEALYERLLTLRPGDADILYNFGNLHVRGSRFPQAVERYEAALEARPDHVPARVNLGNALVMLGRRDEATRHLLIALEVDPTDTDAHRTLGGLFASRGDRASAVRHYRAVLRRSPLEGDVHRDLAVALAAGGRLRFRLAACRDRGEARRGASAGFSCEAGGCPSASRLTGLRPSGAAPRFIMPGSGCPSAPRLTGLRRPTRESACRPPTMPASPMRGVEAVIGASDQ